MRPIREVIDLLPPLNEELVKLAEWMSKYYFSTRLAALEVMIPSALRARYDKILIPGSNVVEEGAYLLGEDGTAVDGSRSACENRIVAQEGRSDRRCDRSLIRKLIREKRLDVVERAGTRWRQRR